MGKASITIGEGEGAKTFSPRRRTYRQLMDTAPLEREIGEATDEANGIQTELGHAYGRLETLAEYDPEHPKFNARARTAIVKEMAEIRARADEAGIKRIELRARAMQQRLDPEPEIDWLLDNLLEGQDEEIEQALNEAVRPPMGSETNSPS